MKKDIHPKFVDAKIISACGNTIETTSMKSTMYVDICSSCHPFFTGKQKLIDAAGRIDKFKKKYAKNA